MIITEFHLTPGKDSKIEPHFLPAARNVIRISGSVTNLQVTYLLLKLIKNETLKVLQLCRATPDCLHILLHVLEMADSHSKARMNYRERVARWKHADADLEEAVEYITVLIQVKTRYALGTLGSLSEA